MSRWFADTFSFLALINPKDACHEAAVQFSVYSGTLEWQDEVTEEQYLGKSPR